jgi:alkylated DNA repair dioxygenase AlkB
VQESLLDLAEEPVLGSLAGEVRRVRLSRGAWLDLRPGWLAGSGAVFGALAEAVPWRAERRHMYDRVVDVPRLLCFYGEDEPLPHPLLTAALEALNAHYGAELGEPFRTAGLCLYRDGRDSVAWHGDRTGRGAREDTMVAILSLGAPRAFSLRPRGGAAGLAASGGGASLAASGGGASLAASGGRASMRYEVGHGDLLVMGGSCQRTWEHAVPKTAQAVGPRISVQFRPRDVR